jgi:sulfate adenylyltransferase
MTAVRSEKDAPVPRSAPPQYCPVQRELDDLELLLAGAYAPQDRFDATSPVSLVLPAEVTTAARAAGVVELVDPEGLPLARVQVDADGRPGGAVQPMQSPTYGPFRRLRLGPGDVAERHRGATFVPVLEPLTDRQLARIAQVDGPVVLLALAGTGTPRAVSPVGLIRATLAAADLVPGADVAVVPFPAHGDGHADAVLAERVVSAYAGGDPVLRLEPGGDLPQTVADVVTTDRRAAARQGVVVFFTGLSGSGKSTLARGLVDLLLEQGTRTVTSLDGDVVRRTLSAGLSFSGADRIANIRRIGWVAAEVAHHGGVAVCSPIAPFDATRKEVRAMAAERGAAFFLVHVATPLEECERRDRKGLYTRARRGEIPEFTGISSPYEPPVDADVRVDTTGRTVADALADIVDPLARAGLLDLPTGRRSSPTGGSASG